MLKREAQLRGYQRDAIEEVIQAKERHLYRRKPVIVEARLFNGENTKDIEWWSSGLVYDNGNGILAMGTKYGTAYAEKGFYIVKGTCGLFYPVKPDEFTENYELSLTNESPRYCKPVTKGESK